MLKQGFMRIGGAEYTLFELQAKSFYRLDIMKMGGAFHFDVDSVLFSCYRKKHHKHYGDSVLYQKYIDTVTYLKKMRGRTINESRWKGATFINIEQKGEKGRRLVVETHNGDWYGETYELNSVSIVFRLVNAAANFVLLPLNDRDFQYSETYGKKKMVFPMSVLRARHGLDWERVVDYRVVAVPKEADAALSEVDLTPDERPIGFDMVTDEAGFVGVVLSHKDDVSFYFPFQAIAFTALPPSYFHSRILPVLRRKTCLVSPDKQSAQFMHSLGADDVGIRYHGSAMEDGRKYLSFSELFVSPQMQDLRMLEKEHLRIYACPAADNCRRSFEMKYERRTQNAVQIK